MRLRAFGISIDLIGVPQGSFFMGSNRGLPLEQPPHEVTIQRPFFMSQYLITQSQWKAVMKASPSHFQTEASLPVDSISWEDAKAFCGLCGRGSGLPVRLPSEAEWEYACRAVTRTEFFWGEDPRVAGEYAWFDLNSDGRTHSVGLKKPNPWGFYDMVGSLWEWCEDVWHSGYDGAPITGDAWMDGIEVQQRRSMRGGAWDMDVFRCRCAYRSFDWKALSTSRFGLRIAIDGSPFKTPA